VRYAVGWDDKAFKVTQTFMDDTPSMTAVLDTLDLLEHDPRPRGSLELGRADQLRIPVGHYRIWYDIDDTHRTVKVTHLGRVP
jgi:mRNA interferase RelE/StbE